MLSLLHKVNQLVQKEKFLHREKERRGENYNVFEVMNAQRDEVSTHSAIIASLLNPQCNHGCQSAFLKIFVDGLKEFLRDTTFRFDTNLNKCRVEVEFNIGRRSPDDETGGRIDLIVESESGEQAIIIENKIYAADQVKQLYRYNNYAQTRYKSYLILYLTLYGTKPSECSSCSLQEGTDFYCIGYNTFIREWLIRCKEKANSFPTVRETITQYYNLVTKLTHQDMENLTTDKLVETLATQENVQALFAITKVRKEVLNRICNTTLREQVEAIAQELGMAYTCSTQNWCERWNGHFFFSKPEWRHFCIGFEFMGDDLTDFNYGIRYASASDLKKYDDIKEAISKEIGGQSNDWWASYKPFKDRNWNADEFERLYDGTIKDETKRIVTKLCDDLKEIEL